MSMVIYIIGWAPLAILCMVAGALSETNDIGMLFRNMGVLAAAVVSGQLFHALVTLPALFYIVCRENPYHYLVQCLPTYCFAFLVSSAATLPVTIKTVIDTGTVDPPIARFVSTLGATINMDASALYFPCVLVFLADSSGLQNEIDAGKMLLIVLVSSLGAVEHHQYQVRG